jgi:hypothetical protein
MAEVKHIIKLNGTTIKNPLDFSTSRYNLTKSGRVASGKMTMELIAKKRKFFFTYEVLSGADLDLILGIIDTDAMFFDITYVENNVTKSAKVYVGEIKYDKFRTDKGWYWKNVTFNLIEQ